jgi:hypothetical protein
VSPGVLAFWIGYFLDLIAIGSLIATSEIHSATLAGIGFIFLIHILGKQKLRISTPLFVALTCLICSTAVFLWIQVQLPLIVAIANCVPILHLALWFISDQSPIARASQLRLAMGFIELIIASILSGSLSLTLAIFLFSLLAAVAISCQFIEKAILENTRSSALFQPQLEPRFILNSFLVAFLVLLSAMLIFPLLPRAKVGFGIEASQRKIGYTEQVTLDQRSPLYGSGGGRVILKLSFTEDSIKNSEELSTSIPLGLLRTKVLNRFDGTSWHPGQSQGLLPRSRLQRKGEPGRWIEFYREPIDSESLPIPYGTTQIRVGENQFPVERMINGEWINSYMRNRPIRYQVAVTHSQDILFGTLSWNPPLPENYEIPKKTDTKAMRQLTKQIFAESQSRALNPDVAVNRLRKFFLREGFKGSTDAVNPQTKLQAIEQFLFVDRSGNCEFFASSAAVLLRMMGIPTRLVAGFRISRSTQGGSLTVRMGDAHAWLEYWIPDRGWKMFDPTPRVILRSSVLDHILESYDLLETFWYRYFYSYDSNFQAELTQKTYNQILTTQTRIFNKDQWMDWLKGMIERANNSIALITGFLILFISIIYVFFRFTAALFSFRSSAKNGPRVLQIRRRAMDQILRSAGHSTALEHPALQIYSHWNETYLLARFGKDTIERPQLSELVKSLKMSEATLKAALKEQLSKK